MDEKLPPPPGTPAPSLRASLILPPLPISLWSHFSSCCRPCRCLFFSFLPAPLISPQRESSCSSHCPTSLTSVALPSSPRCYTVLLFLLLPRHFRIPSPLIFLEFYQISLDVSQIVRLVCKNCLHREVWNVSSEMCLATKQQSVSYCWHCNVIGALTNLVSAC